LLNNNTEQTEIEFTYIPNIRYGFYVEATDKAGNKEVKSSLPEVTFYKETLGIKDVSATKPVVYPNPTNGILHIENAVGQEIKVYDVLGNLLLATHEDKIDMSGYSNGIYLLHVGNKIVKVVKQ